MSNDLASLVQRVEDRTRDVLARTFRLSSDADAVVTRDEVILATRSAGRAAVDASLLPAVFDFFRAHVQAWGWFYPVAAETLEEALTSLRAAKTPAFSANARAGADFLRGAFASYWNTDDGPARSFHDDKALNNVLRYRLGLNNSKDYTYTLHTGEVVATRETFDLNIKNVRRGFVVQRKAPSFFKPGVAKSIYQRWVTAADPVVWDPSGGFGGRLLGFAAAFPSGAYLACEPAAQTHRDLSALGRALVEGKHLRHAAVVKAGSETMTFAPETLDFVFTSPPYFDLERYYDEPGQCWRDHATETQWIEGYVLPTLRAAYTGLRGGCFAVFNVDTRRREVFVASAARAGFTLADEHALALGSDHFARKRGADARAEPILVFRKPAG